MVKIKEIKCNNCNSPLPIKNIFKDGLLECSYCGTFYEYFPSEHLDNKTDKNIFKEDIKGDYSKPYKTPFFNATIKFLSILLSFSFIVFLFMKEKALYFLDIEKTSQLEGTDKIFSIIAFIFFIISSIPITIRIIKFYVFYPKY